VSADVTLPFKMSVSDPLSLWRAKTFWLKEPETVEWLKFFGDQKNSPCEILVDVGANIGVFTLYWCSLNKNFQTISIEPFDKNYNLLISNVDKNNFNNQVKIYKHSLSSKKSYGMIEVSDLRPGSSSFKFSPVDSQGLDLSSLVESSTLDILLQNNEGLKILKIDVDGNDFDVLKGAEKSLASKNIVSILIESSENQQYKINNYLTKFGFESDDRFNNLASHSDIRRKAHDKVERNRVYTQSDYINNN
jgi:FkbM family methyltransferase